MLIKTNDINLIQKLDQACFLKEAYSNATLMSMQVANEFYIVQEQDINVGFMIVQKIDNDYELIKIGILASYRHQHYAFQALKEFIINHNFNKFFLEVSCINMNAIKLYEKLGFKLINRRKVYYQDGQDALIMCYLKN